MLGLSWLARRAKASVSVGSGSVKSPLRPRLAAGGASAPANAAADGGPRGAVAALRAAFSAAARREAINASSCVLARSCMDTG